MTTRNYIVSETVVILRDYAEYMEENPGSTLIPDEYAMLWIAENAVQYAAEHERERGR